MNDDGEVNHRYFLSKLIAPFYEDYVGLEYNGEIESDECIATDLVFYFSRLERWII